MIILYHLIFLVFSLKNSLFFSWFTSPPNFCYHFGLPNYDTRSFVLPIDELIFDVFSQPVKNRNLWWIHCLCDHSHFNRSFKPFLYCFADVRLFGPCDNLNKKVRSFTIENCMAVYNRQSTSKRKNNR